MTVETQVYVVPESEVLGLGLEKTFMGEYLCIQ